MVFSQKIRILGLLSISIIALFALYFGINLMQKFYYQREAFNIGNAFKDVGRSITSTGTDAGRVITDTGTDAGKTIEDTGKGVVKTLEDTYREGWNAVQTWFDQTNNQLTSKFDEIKRTFPVFLQDVNNLDSTMRTVVVNQFSIDDDVSTPELRLKAISDIAQTPNPIRYRQSTMG